MTNSIFPFFQTPVKPQNQCFIQMIPRKDLFTEYLTPINYDIFFHMMKQCFGRRSALLIQHLQWVKNKSKYKSSNIVFKSSNIMCQYFMLNIYFSYFDYDTYMFHLHINISSSYCTFWEKDIFYMLFPWTSVSFEKTTRESHKCTYLYLSLSYRNNYRLVTSQFREVTITVTICHPPLVTVCFQWFCFLTKEGLDHHTTLIFFPWIHFLCFLLNL